MTYSMKDLNNRHIRLTKVLDVKSDICNQEGDRFITIFVKYPKQKTMGITTFTLFPRDLSNGGYMFELSPQIGCSVGCPFCGVPPFERSLTEMEIFEQVIILTREAIRRDITIRGPYKYSFTDGGELLQNRRCLAIVKLLSSALTADFKISSVLPNTQLVKNNIKKLLVFAEKVRGKMTMQLQISMFSTDEKIRRASSKRSLMPSVQIAEMGKQWLEATGRKPTLTFTLTDTSHCQADEIVNILPPKLFMVRLFPYKLNGLSGIKTINPKQLTKITNEFIGAGYKLVPCQTDPVERRNALLLSGTLTYRKK